MTKRHAELIQFWLYEIEPKHAEFLREYKKLIKIKKKEINKKKFVLLCLQAVFWIFFDFVLISLYEKTDKSLFSLLPSLLLYPARTETEKLWALKFFLCFCFFMFLFFSILNWLSALEEEAKQSIKSKDSAVYNEWFKERSAQDIKKEFIEKALKKGFSNKEIETVHKKIFRSDKLTYADFYRVCREERNRFGRLY